MMKKKLASALVVLTGVIAFSSSQAEARRYHQRGVHAVRHSVQKHHTNAFAHRRGGRHASRSGGSGRPAAWCGWWLGQHLGMSNRNLWLARNWASVGSNAGQPDVGVVVVWRHHVGIITGRQGNQWVVKSGNDGRAVRERVRSIAVAIAFRRVGAGFDFSS
jgi:hypothetical protein